MSESPGLGIADGESRWIGIRRHQAALVISALGLVGEWFTQVHASVFELLFGVALLACATPTSDGLTIGERCRIGASFVARSRWTLIRASQDGGAMTVVAGGESTSCGFELQHRGRLDLCGLDHHHSASLAHFADALAAAEVTRHFSVHVCTSPIGVHTLLSAPTDVSPPTGWTLNCELALEAAHVGTESASWLLERWTYVRAAHGVMRVLRVRDFSAVPDGRALLERVQFASTTLDVAVHVDVVGGARAHRLAARAVHRVGSDDATSQAAGFRRTAQSAHALERLRQREALVVDGTALLRIAVYVVIRATTLRELRRDVRAVMRCAQESGLRCEPGFGRQSLWYRAQLPGAPGW